MSYVYVIEYDDRLSTQGYLTLDEAIDRLEGQGYEQHFGLVYRIGMEHIAYIKPIQVTMTDDTPEVAKLRQTIKDLEMALLFTKDKLLNLLDEKHALESKINSNE